MIGRTSAQEAQLLHAAHASAFHWGHVGNELHSAHPELLLVHVYVALGHGELAQNYAGHFTSYLLSNSPSD